MQQLGQSNVMDVALADLDTCGFSRILHEACLRVSITNTPSWPRCWVDAACFSPLGHWLYNKNGICVVQLTDQANT